MKTFVITLFFYLSALSLRRRIPLPIKPTKEDKKQAKEGTINEMIRLEEEGELHLGNIHFWFQIQQ